MEKDYYVTEALRIIASSFGDVVLFKGGTSLSKGWKLIERFSEDIDLYVQEDTFTSRATDRRLKAIAQAICDHPRLTPDDRRKKVIGGLGRTDYFLYPAQSGIVDGIDAAVMLEAGIQSGDYPVEERPIQSLVGHFLDQRRVQSGAEDQASFAMRLLHFRRTLVEKLYTIHDRVERLVKQRGEPLGSYARHYYDIHRLLVQDEVQAMLRTPEYASIAADYRRLTARFFRDQALPPGMELRHSAALFPDVELRARLAPQYTDQCSRLCYGRFPTFQEVLDALEEIRELLIYVPE